MNTNAALYLSWSCSLDHILDPIPPTTITRLARTTHPASRTPHHAPRTMSAQPPETPTKAGAATGAATGAAWSDAEKIAYMLVVAEHALDAALESKVSVRQMHST
jgi:hypothetical protein